MTTNFKRIFPFQSEKHISPPSKKSKVESFCYRDENLNVNQVSVVNCNFGTEKKKKESNMQNFGSKKWNAPLAEKMRPKELSDYIGQSHLIGPKTLLYNLLKKGVIPSMILCGPPGCGKTSLINVIIQENKKHNNNMIKFIKLSATSASINDVRKAVAEAETQAKQGIRTVVFMDEIHRFNKLQQDIFLPHVEAGTFILIGATTENPSSSLNSALLSRCRVFILKKLDKNDLISILSKAITSLNGKIISKNDEIKESSNIEFFIEHGIIDWLAEVCDGDARIALGAIEMAIRTKLSNTNNNSQPAILSLNDVKESLKEAQGLTDKTVSLHHMYSALHYSIVGEDDNAALYWLARIMAANEDPVCIAKKLIKIASENISINDEIAFSTAVNTLHACQMIGMPECDVMLAQCVVYLARAEKSKEIAKALSNCINTIENFKGPQPSVPFFIKDSMAQKKIKATLGQNFKNMISDENLHKSYLPKDLENVDFFKNDKNTSF